MEKILRGTFFCNYRCLFFIRRLARSVVPFAQICAFVLLVYTMLGLRAWGDDLNVVLFEFLEDDKKLAQSCTDWLYVQHWYTVVPEPSMGVTLWALMGAGGNCHEHMQDTPLHFFAFLGFCWDRHHQCDCTGRNPLDPLLLCGFHLVLPLPMLSNRTCLFCSAPSPDQQPSPSSFAGARRRAM